jgi:hypothetical protein
LLRLQAAPRAIGGLAGGCDATAAARRRRS